MQVPGFFEQIAVNHGLSNSNTSLTRKMSITAPRKAKFFGSRTGGCLPLRSDRADGGQIFKQLGYVRAGKTKIPIPARRFHTNQNAIA
ncbi:hypothetical protein [Rahnella bruchi]|jgi:hypothetical protein|uniref:hypothetical protein n=1 Tax=Rahnella bruchi TaxID=1510573 RepID=UPI000EA1637C|nr:hypothetical protein [Rahnella bruchi]